MKQLSFARRALCAAPLAIAAFATLSTSSAARAQLTAPPEKPVVGARMPALSADGKKIAFVWRGDVWVSDATGGRAYPVTSHVEMDGYPVWSPDGRWIAFSSTRNGNWDIFVVPSQGGAARQMTFSSGAEIATDWSPDGKNLIFASSRDTVNSTLFSLDVATLRFHKVTEDYKGLANATYSPDGRSLTFQRSGFPWTRPRYHGSGAAQLWTVGVDSGARTTVVDDERQHLWPHYLPDGQHIVAVSVGEETPNAQWLDKPLPRLADNEKRTPNLWEFAADGKDGKGGGRQLTHFVGGSVRFPAVARTSGAIAFEHEQDLFLLAPGAKEPQKLALFCADDDKTNNVQRQTFTNSDVSEAEISPDGKTFGFVLKNDLWTIPVEKAKSRNANDAVRLTDYPGFDHDFTWSKDNSQLFFVSDRNENDRIFALDVASHAVRPLWTGNEDAYGPYPTPDGRSVAFWVRGSESVAGLYLKSIAADAPGLAPKRVLPIVGASQGEFSFSPDMRYLVYTRRSRESGSYNLYLVKGDGSGTPVNLTRLNAGNGMPAWSPDGKFLFFQSNRDGNGLYVLPLQPEEAPIDELEIKYVKPATLPAPTVDVDMTDTSQRIRKVSDQNPDADLNVGVDGVIRFVNGGDIVQLSYDGKEVKRLTTGGGVSSLRVSSDAKTLFFVKGGGLNSMPAGGGAITQVAFTAQWERNVRDERRVAFTQLWRSYNRGFYDGNFHGRDWAAIRQRYEPLIDGVGTREEFANLLNMMIGELEASHSEIGAAASPVVSPVTRQLGVYFDYGYVGPGIKVKDVPKRAPGAYSKTRIKAGEYIVAIDGKDVTLDENLYKVLNDKGDRDFVLTVNSTPTRAGAHTVTYKALTGGEWSDIHYRNRVERERNEVDKLSGGTVGYVHIAGMGGANQTTFDRELYEYAEGKKAMIVDVRFNGGGNIADNLINWLAIKPYATFQPRDGYAEPGPSRGWNKPIVVLMNEQSFSNAEMFPYDMRATGLAKLVGMPTPGYVIWTGEFELVDGTHARMPGSGVYRKDGSPMEDMGEVPDVTVPFPNEDWLADRDPQLAKAVEVLLR